MGAGLIIGYTRNTPFNAVIEFKGPKGRIQYSYFDSVQDAKAHIAEYWESVLKPVGGLVSYVIRDLQRAETPKTIIGYCFDIREAADRNASSPCAPTITEAECMEATLLYMLKVYGRKPSRAFNAELRKLQVAYNKKGTSQDGHV